MEGTPRTEGELAAEVSNAIVQLFSKYYGRGPVKAKTFLVENYVMTVLEETLTTAEQTLVDAGRYEMVRNFRLTFQSEMADEFTSTVAGIVGTPVKTYHSQIAFNPTACFEFFILEEPPRLSER